VHLREGPLPLRLHLVRLHVITRWLNQDTGSASGTPPTVPILITDVQYVVNAASDSWQTVVYVYVKGKP
jgi:hypothetical protein